MGKGQRNQEPESLRYQPLSAEEWEKLARGENLEEEEIIRKRPLAEKTVRLYLDDLRPTPPGWVGVKTVAEAIAILKDGRVIEISFDNDLGEGQPEGYELCDWMAQHKLWPEGGVSVHSDNASRSNHMCEVIEHNTHGIYRRQGRRFIPIANSLKPE